MDDGAGAADAGLYRQRSYRAVARTGTALDAGVAIAQPCAVLLHFHHAVGANGGAHPATDALRNIQLQGDDVFQIA